MNGESSLRPRCVSELGAMLPWYVNGTLAPEEQRAFRLHLDECSTCRAEMTAHRAMREEMAASPDALPDPLVSLGPLMKRIASHGQEGPRGWRWRWPQLPGTRVLAGALAVQAVAILALAVAVVVLLARPQPAAEYYTLGTPSAEQPRDELLVRLMLEESLDAAGFRALLEETGARLIAGPDESGGYLVGVGVHAADGEAEALDLVRRLASRTGVVTAVPLKRAETE
jgi:hypothetical protein